jgi:23S rRNA pseudouridine2605 synthase
MARNSRFSSTSGPSKNRNDKKGKPFRKDERPRRRDDDATERKPSFRTAPGSSPNRNRAFKKEEARPRRRDDEPSDRKTPFKSLAGKGKGSFKGGRDTDRERKPGKPVQARPFSRTEKPFEKREPRRESPSFSRESRTAGRAGDRDDRIKPSDNFRGKPTERKSFVESRQDKERQRRSSPMEKETTSKDDLIRLNKYISNSGVCSRREADDLIAMGLITVNGKVVTELGYKVRITDDVRHDGKRLKAEKPVYILLNKPKGFITTTDDPQDRNTVMNLIEGACRERVYPVGRLDRNTSGLLLLTNDGDLTEKLSHPSHNVKKIYKAELDRPLTKADFQKLRDGVRLEEGKAVVDDLAIISEDGKTVGLELHIGWNRIVRRLFEALGYQVEKLDRSVYATLDKKDLPRGHWRFLRQDEVIRLKHFQ